MRKKALTQELTIETYITTSVVIKSSVVKLNGTSPLFLAIKQGKNRKSLSLQMYWPNEFFDRSAQALLPRKKKDLEWIDQDIILNAIKAKCSKIINDHRVKNQPLSIAEFIQQYTNYASRDSFFFYADMKNAHRYKEGISTHRTKLRHGSGLNLLRQFFKGGELLMCDINLDLVRKFDAWLRKQGYKYNYITATHKTFRTYLNFALADKYHVEYPYAKFPIKFVDSARPSLTIDEVKKLHQLMGNQNVGMAEAETLRKFLFSCYTGLRISDSNVICSTQIIDGILTHKLVKGLRFGTEVVVKIPNIALKLIEGRTGRLFPYLNDATVNKSLKILAVMAGINKKLTFHVSRDTYATIFITMGGDIASLKDLMGHDSIQTTMKYIKMDKTRKDALMDNFDTMFT